MQKAKQISAKILEEWENKELPARIHLFQGLPKGDKMELIIQKAVELGAYRVVPVSMKRSVVKLDAKKADAKRKRWNAVSESVRSGRWRCVAPGGLAVALLPKAVSCGSSGMPSLCGFVPWQRSICSVDDLNGRSYAKFHPSLSSLPGKTGRRS